MGGDIDNEDGTVIKTYEARISSGRTKRLRRTGRTVTPRTEEGNEALRGRSTENRNARRGKVKQVSAKMAMMMTAKQYQTLIDALRGGGDGEAAGAAGAAAREGPVEPCALGENKLKRIMRWTNWHREAENKMRLRGITDNVKSLNCLRR